MGPAWLVAGIVLMGGDRRMALLEEMQVLAGDLEAAFSRRAGDERERLAAAVADARERAGDERERVAAAVADAGERAAQMAVRRVEVAGTLGEFHRDRVLQSAHDARERAGDERERVAAAAGDARERAAQILELGKIWSDHSTAMGSLRGRVFRPPAPAAARRKAAEPAPTTARRKAAEPAPTTASKAARPATAARRKAGA